jgi:DNA-binding MarR family transcriptional regulator
MALGSEQDFGLQPSQYAAIAAFRLELRRFLAFSEAAATAAGLPPQQHQALLAIAGHTGAELPSIGTIAEQLLIAPNSAAELVVRMVGASLLTKTPSRHDRRRMELVLTEQASVLLHRLTAAHLNELKTLEPALRRALERLHGPVSADPPGDA